MSSFLKLGALLILGFGIFFITQAMLPLISYQVWEWRNLRANSTLITPLAQQQNGFMSSRVLGVSVAEANSDLIAGLPAVTRDYKPNYESFTLSIPKLKISQAIVKVDGDSPDRSLILVPGMALPGEKGNVFIAGHSNYWQLFGPDNWYLSIFKNLNDLTAGDEIIANVQGQDFHYRVKSLRVYDPKDLAGFKAPDSSGRYISLMTCVPPGTSLKRLIVLGELE